MQLSKQAINEFMEIYLKDYGVNLSYEEAKQVATAFFNQMKNVYKPISKQYSKKWLPSL
jgi:hypothetical protein